MMNRFVPALRAVAATTVRTPALRAAPAAAASFHTSAPAAGTSGKILDREPIKVLVGIDGSMAASAAVQSALELAQPQDEIHLAYVPPVLGLDLSQAGTNLVHLFEEQRDKMTESVVTEYEKQVTAVHDADKVFLHVGAPTGGARSELLRLSEEVGAHTLVLGSRGMGAVKRALVGSVVDYCVHHAACNVLVVKT